jgi:cold shock CspA family protein
MLVKVPAPPIMAGMFATRVRRVTGMVEHNPSAFLDDGTSSPSQWTETMRAVTVPLGSHGSPNLTLHPKDVFVHLSTVEQSGLGGLNDGQKLAYETEAGRRPGQVSAINLKAL